MIFNLSSVKRDRAGEPDGGGSKTDPGVPHFHNLDDSQPDRQESSGADIALKALQDQVKALQEENRESKQNEKYWADRFKSVKLADIETPEPDVEAPVRRELRKMRDGETADEFLDDVGKKGLPALLARGVITEQEFEDRMEKFSADIEKRVERRIEQATVGAEFDQKMGREFPELNEDNARVSAGEKPKGEMYIRTGKHFQEMMHDAGVKLDSAAARGLLYAAAKLAKKEIGMERTNRREEPEDREEGRRRRIAAQSGERGGDRDDDDGAPPLSKMQLTVMKNLGLTQGEVDASSKRAGANGR